MASQSYSEAQADAVPAYWETTVHAPAVYDPNADMIVDDLPTGSVLFFIATSFVSYFFQFIGFFLTYLLHTTHAAKYGSRAGLGLTLIQFGFYSRAESAAEQLEAATLLYGNGTSTRGITNMGSTTPLNGTYVDPALLEGAFNIKDWVSLMLMAFGRSPHAIV